MVREIVHDPVFLSQKCTEATAEDIPIAQDLIDTLKANMDRCVGMAANMIGKRKRIIAVAKGPMIIAMLNPEIIGTFEEYEAEEGCLSLEGIRKVKRYRSIRLKWSRSCSMRWIIVTGYWFDQYPVTIQLLRMMLPPVDPADRTAGARAAGPAALLSG